jgi:ATP-dependent DNA helicase RecG
MVRPLETLNKMLELEERDYEYQDHAVAGGLSRYARTWRKQALDIFGASAELWIDEVVQKMQDYSSADREARPDILNALRAHLHAGPHLQDEAHEAAEAKADAERPRETESEVVTEEIAAPQAVEPEAEEGRGLDAPVQEISGIGDSRAEDLANLGILTIRDLLRHYPSRYEDYSKLKTINQLEYGERVSLLATVWEAGGRRTRSGQNIFQAILSDHTGTLKVTWFNQAYLESRIKQGMEILVSGQIDEYLGHLTMTNPQWEEVGAQELMNARIQPIYPLTEGVTQTIMRKAVRRALSAWAHRVPEGLPDDLRLAHGLLTIDRALWGIHLPDSSEHLGAARRRHAFEESLYLQLGLIREKLRWKSKPGVLVTALADRIRALTDALPYELTEAQVRSLNEMLADMASGQPMNRLLQGDVGSGKTVVAALLMSLVAESGFQAAMMAPTEILAEQHYQSLSEMFASLPEPQPSVVLLTGNTRGEERERIYQALADGSLQVVVGTHALIQAEVVFDNLALVIIDEQHRFGVEQRGTLREKGDNPHLLVMTATPIPRSLELTVWGHLDVSVLDEMPPGRRPVRTRVYSPQERERAYLQVRAQVDKGRQAFIIYPLVEASDKIDARAAVDEYERLRSKIFPDLRLGLLHGRLHPDEKDAVMKQFADGELDVLVATSVVEVGIDVPNATIMLVDGAERFGLAQLHQFRGRVGRGAHQSYCILLAKSRSSEATERLSAMESTNDGFLLAEKDLQMRGPGEFLGTRQSGLPELRMVSYVDTRMLHKVREVAREILENDPTLSDPEHKVLALRVAEFWTEAGDLS